MPTSAKPIPESNIVEIYVTGKLTVEDYHEFMPVVEGMINEHGKVRLAFYMSDFHGWRLGALWEDLKFEIKHFSQVERIAFIGESLWEKGMARFCMPFSGAMFRFFKIGQEELAKTWLATGTFPAHEELADDLSVVYTSNDAMQAEIIAIALRGEGIPTHLSDIHQGGYTGMFEVDILVRNKDLDRAAAFIKRHEERK